MIRVNLIKAETKEFETPAALLEGEAPEKKKKKAPIPTNLLIVLAVVIVGVLGFLLKQSIDKERALLRSAEEEKAALQPVLTKLSSIGEQKAFLERKINLINDLKARQGEAVRLMETLSEALPDWVWLTEVHYARRSITIKGKALTNILISDFMHNLETSGLFDMVSLMGSQARNQGATQYLEFNLQANVPAPAAAAPAAKVRKAP